MPENLDTPSSINSYFDENGYYLAQGIYSESDLQKLETDFDRIVEKLESSGEDVNARWESKGTDELDGGESRIIHTHNVHRDSACWLNAFQQDKFLDAAEQIIGSDIMLLT